MGVVNDDAGIILDDIVGHRERAGLWVADDCPSRLGAEAQRLAVLERNDPLVASRRILNYLKRAVVKDVAVLVDLHKRSALMVRRLPKHRRQVLAVRVQRAGNERGLGTESQRDGGERVVQRAKRCRLGYLALLGRG